MVKDQCIVFLVQFNACTNSHNCLLCTTEDEATMGQVSDWTLDHIAVETRGPKCQGSKATLSKYNSRCVPVIKTVYRVQREENERKWSNSEPIEWSDPRDQLVLDIRGSRFQTDNLSSWYNSLHVSVIKVCLPCTVERMTQQRTNWVIGP